MKPESVTPDLPDDYYLVNFNELLQFVVSAYSDLLTPREMAFAKDFSSLPERAARLYVRLLLRSKELFRLDKLSYPEIGNLEAATLELEATGFLLINPPLTPADSLTLLTKPEIVSWLAEQPDGELESAAVRKLKRRELDEYVVGLVENARVGGTGSSTAAAPSAASLTASFQVLQTRHEALFQTCKLCFFGNLYQDMTDFVLRDLGLTRFENYRIDKETRAFVDRPQLEAHLQYYAVLERAEALDVVTVPLANELNDALPEATDLNLQRRIDRFRNRVARQLERGGEFEAALHLYEQSMRPPARERRARILAANGREPDSLSLCREVLQNPVNEEELQIVSGFASRLAKKTGVDWAGETPYKPEVQTITLIDTGESVETQAQQYFNTAGQCFYTENVLIDGVFGLAFWEQIFMPVPGVFFNPFQHAPSDFYDAGFLEARRQAIDLRFKELSKTGVLASEVKDRFAAKQGLQNPMVNWRYLHEPLLEIALQRVPVDHWLAMFRRLLSDTRLNRSGLPDLIHFPDSGAPYVLIEIKGPGDVLQKNQQRWMQFFKAVGIDHKLCHVRYKTAAADCS